MNFSTKERYLLEDQKNHEKICIQKYSNYANLASDQQLKNIFKQNGQIEQEHYNTIDQLLKGQMPAMNQQGGGQSGSSQSGSQQSGSMQQSQPQMQSMIFQNTNQSGSQGNSNFNTNDRDLCTDMLMTEKYVSGAYNTAIFEFRDTQVRNILNHIQKEEQQHGEAIFKYMESKGMYQAQ
ncbi:MAG: spore coat protein [Sedimentibacter sp.]|uniref:spore coat protein n=1 Tax=Sedimentibacter sp. TaxID=1960295 RepID=UPI003158732C